jgi:hypothetical protein
MIPMIPNSRIPDILGSFLKKLNQPPLPLPCGEIEIPVVTEEKG